MSYDLPASVFLFEDFRGTQYTMSGCVQRVCSPAAVVTDRTRRIANRRRPINYLNDNYLNGARRRSVTISVLIRNNFPSRMCSSSCRGDGISVGRWRFHLICGGTPLSTTLASNWYIYLISDRRYPRFVVFFQIIQYNYCVIVYKYQSRFKIGNLQGVYS